MKAASNLKTNTTFTPYAQIFLKVKVVLFFRFEAVFMPKWASEKEQLWQLGEARVFDQMTSDQASGGLKHEYYHLQDQHHNSFQMTRPIQ